MFQTIRKSSLSGIIFLIVFCIQTTTVYAVPAKKAYDMQQVRNQAFEQYAQRIKDQLEDQLQYIGLEQVQILFEKNRLDHIGFVSEGVKYSYNFMYESATGLLEVIEQSARQVHAEQPIYQGTVNVFQEAETFQHEAKQYVEKFSDSDNLENAALLTLNTVAQPSGGIAQAVNLWSNILPAMSDPMLDASVELQTKIYDFFSQMGNDLVSFAKWLLCYITNVIFGALIGMIFGALFIGLLLTIMAPGAFLVAIGIGALIGAVIFGMSALAHTIMLDLSDDFSSCTNMARRNQWMTISFY